MLVRDEFKRLVHLRLSAETPSQPVHIGDENSDDFDFDDELDNFGILTEFESRQW